jgi:hypothetical protein
LDIEISPSGKSSQGMKLITHLHIVLRMPMSVAILPLFHMPLWHMQGFLPVSERLYFFPSVSYKKKIKLTNSRFSQQCG